MQMPPHVTGIDRLTGRSGDYFALAMNYPAVANHAVNRAVHVYCHLSVSSLKRA